MRCSLVVNQLNDPFYIDYDEEFARHIIKTSKDKGLIEKDAVITELDANLVMQLFSPLVLSQWLLIDQTKEPCSSVRCPNGFCFVFRHVDGLLFVTISGEVTDSEQFLHRKTQIFIRLMKFLFGPVSEEIGQSHYSSKRAKWKFLRSLMRTWSEMITTEQAFLVEAMERLSVNQLVSEKCIEILRRTVKQMHGAQEQPTQHAVLLVNSKLLALYSNRNAHELRPKDVLSLVILCKTMYPRYDRLEDLFSKQYTSKNSRSSSYDENSDGVEDGEEEYHSAPATPECERRTSCSSSCSDKTEENVVIHQTGSVSVSDTDTVINSMMNLSHTHDDRNDEMSPRKKDMTLVDMYNEKYTDLVGAPDSVFDTDGTETTEEMSCVDHLVVADVHHEQGEVITNDSVSDSTAMTAGKSLSDGGMVGANSPDFENKEKTNASGGLDLERDVTRNPDTLSLESSSDSDIKRGDSRASTVSSANGSIASNKSNPFRELSLQVGSETPVIESSLRLKHRQNRNRKKTSDHKHSRKNQSQSQSSGTRTRKIPSPSSTDDTSVLSSDTLQNSVSNSLNNGTYLPQTLFLETSTCPYSPHTIHTTQVLPGVTLVLLSQAPRHSMAEPLYQVMSIVQDLIYRRRIKLPRSRSLHVYEIINSLLGKLHNMLRKFKGRERNLIYDIHARWEKEDVKQKLLEFLEKDSNMPIPPELESPLMEMYKKLRELFSLLHLSPLPDNPQFWTALSQLRVSINAELLDYRAYLNVKSLRNITMTTYFEKYPGLIHFIFVDRRLHQMIAPSLNISLKEGETMNASLYLKDNIWRMYQHMMEKLTEGYTTTILREGDFYYSYFLWFEDSLRNAVPVQESFKPSHKSPYPGILCGNFYNDILHQCFPHVLPNSVMCYEMFLMHVGSVHPQYIASHCKKLAVELWDMSGDAYTNPSLF